jgi:hypothetical protein
MAVAPGRQSQIVCAQVKTRQRSQKTPAIMAPKTSQASNEPPCSRADGIVKGGFAVGFDGWLTPGRRSPLIRRVRAEIGAERPDFGLLAPEKLVV